jgi:MrfA Zn-binding domain
VTTTAAPEPAPTAKSFKVGKLRPSQVVTQHGPGAIVDLPELSVVMAGTNHWYPSGMDRVYEPRLEAHLDVSALFRPPQPGPGAFGGLPAFVFPEYLVCPYDKCRRLAPFREFTPRGFGGFGTAGEFICNGPAHAGTAKRFNAFPARFMVACARGHLDDFPWSEWVHAGAACPGDLRLIDTGSSGAASDLIVKCERCGNTNPMGDAFQPDAHVACSARRPWLGPSDRDPDGCPESPRTILRGASNAYFSIVASALSIPPWSDPIQTALARYRDVLQTADSFEKLKTGVEMGFYNISDLLNQFTIEQIWKALSAEPEAAEQNLKIREYRAFIHPEVKVEEGTEFEIQRCSVPNRYGEPLSAVMAASRLREVRALRGFTRIDSIPDLGERTDVRELDAKVAPIGLSEVHWRPAIDLRGEGVFLRIAESAIKNWEQESSIRERGSELEKEFGASWKFEDEVLFPGMRFVLLHTLAHALIRQMSLDCGYSSSALRERIYSSANPDPMAGILIYTATTDSDGSLGGLVDLARPERLEPIITLALTDMRFCASDPLCASGESGAHANLNGAACHACLLIAETSCEIGNRLLDRAVLTGTLAGERMRFFG